MRPTSWVYVLITLSAVLLVTVGQSYADESLANNVPADVGLFIEGRGLEDLLLPLTEPQAWLTLAELGGQPARIDETFGWRVQVWQTVRMNPAEAIRVLFSRQFAFIGERPRRAQDAVVLCRPKTEIKLLLERWQAQPLPHTGRTSVYQLPNRIGLAVPDGLVMFGDAGLSKGMFQRTLEFMDHKPGGQSLSDDQDYRSLISQVPQNPDAVLFARLHRSNPSTSAPALVQPELPGPLRGAANILLALHRDGDLLHFSAVGDSRSLESDRKTGLKDLFERLPERTLFGWGFHLDYPQLVQAVNTLPERSVLRLTFKLQQRSGVIQRLTESLGSATCLAVGVVDPDGRTVPAPPMPALAVLINLEEPETAADAIHTLMQATVSIYNLMSLKVGAQPLSPPATIPVSDSEVELLDLSQLVHSLPYSDAFPELHICWTIDDGTLIMASHLDWLRQILAARHDEDPTLATLLELGRGPIAPSSESVIVIQTGPIADLGRLWLKHLEKTAPEVLEEDWWRQRQPGGSKVHLGIQVTELPEERRLRITTVQAGQPADGILEPGDEIVGHGRRRFATSQPVHEIRRGITQRKNARWLDLLVERGGTTLVRRIPLPFVDPVQVLRRAIAIGKLSQRVLYHDDVPGATGGRGFLTIELRKPGRQFFPFSLSPARQPVKSTPIQP